MHACIPDDCDEGMREQNHSRTGSQKEKAGKPKLKKENKQMTSRNVSRDRKRKKTENLNAKHRKAHLLQVL